LTIKDSVHAVGTPWRHGCAANADVPDSTFDSPPAARLKEAGAVIVGKTTMPDFGMMAAGVSSLYGITRNPWDTSRNSGGSSAGAGAALASGIGFSAVGTDIAGSVRLPASYNGVFALKPSLGRIPIYPPFLGRVTGPMTRTVSDAALAMTALTKPDTRDYMALPVVLVVVVFAMIVVVRMWVLVRAMFARKPDVGSRERRHVFEQFILQRCRDLVCLRERQRFVCSDSDIGV
jgi:amidase/aspartyl-tRNA(Asn)/glutamyl-tRNA(Gln) amidotransferase subunit A